MKLNRLIVSSTFLIILLSCEPVVYFNEPQPKGEKNLRQFPPRLKGNYLCQEDSSVMIIYTNRIILQNSTDFHISKLELDTSSAFKLEANFILDISSGQKFPVELNNDTFSGKSIYKDTFFLISPDQILRKYKGFFFLNFKDDTGWYVYRLCYSKGGQLEINAIDVKEEIENLKAVTDVTEIKNEEDIIINYTAKPAKKEFREFLKMQTFTIGTKYQKFKP